jgi:general secretion pathway protein D
MKRFVLLPICAVLVAAAPPRVVMERAPSPPVRVQMESIPLGTLVTLLMRDVLRVPYVIAPDVLQDRRPVSVNLVMPRSQLPERVVGFLRSVGLSVRLDGGTVYVARKDMAAGRQSSAAVPGSTDGRATVPGSAGSYVPSGSPLSPGRPSEYVEDTADRRADRRPDRVDRRPESPDLRPDLRADGRVREIVPDTDLAIIGYIPAHREPTYLASILKPLLPDLVLGNRSEVEVESGAQTIAPRGGPDVLVLTGSSVDLKKARAVIAVIDRPRPQVAVRAVVMEVRDEQSRSSAVSLFVQLAGGRVSVGAGVADPAASQFVRIASGALTAALSSARKDGRFKVVATPNLVALDGLVSTMNAGAQVPTIGSVSVTENGTPVQSVSYRDSGITLTIRPMVRGNRIQLDVKEERSSFVRTTTGVVDSPTLQRSAAEASVVLVSGESVVLAGLSEESSARRRDGILGGIVSGKSRESSKSELLVVLSAELVAAAEVGPGEFVEIFDPEAEPEKDLPEDAKPRDLAKVVSEI